MGKRLLHNFSLFNVFFLTLGGYYAILILVSNYLSNEMSRSVTIPIRFIILLSIIYLYVKTRVKNKKNKSIKYFTFFSIAYLIRIFIEYLKYDALYMSETMFLFYFLSFVVIPLYLISNTNFSLKDYRIIFNTIIIGSVSVAILTYFFYGNLIGEVTRISQEIGKEENYISPLALSYTSVLGIGTAISYILTNKLNNIRLFILLFSIILCFIPFFLGASRGSVFAALIPLFLYFITAKGLTKKIKFVFIVLVFLSLVVLATKYFGVGVFDRFTNISRDIEMGSTSAIRLMIWKDGIRQFLENPLFGNSLQSELVHHHPHNILIESLMSTGIIGSIPLFIFFFIVFKKVIVIIRNAPKYFWITNIFLTGFTMNMFSGAIWGMSWVALGSALILGFENKMIKNEIK